MNADSLFHLLLSAGRLGDFEGIRSLPGAGIHSQVLRIADRDWDALFNFFIGLEPIDQTPFVKAIAVYESTVGGLGSVTTLARLLPLLTDPDHVVLDWILSSTASYSYYSRGATSFSEMCAVQRARQLRRADALCAEEARASTARASRAVRATGKLYGAIRRGDTKAVEALLKQGGDPKSTTPDGLALHEYAVSRGHIDIAALLIGEMPISASVPAAEPRNED